MSTISAGTTSTTALVSTGDTTGNLILATGSVPTTALTLNSTTQAATFAGAVNFASWTTATRPASPSNGQMGYNTTTGLFDQYTAAGWGPVAANGTVLQVQSGYFNSTATISSGSFLDTGITVSITPKFSTSKILVLATIQCSGGAGSNYVRLNLVRNSTTIAQPATSGSGQPSTANSYVGDLGISSEVYNVSMNYLDSPATTSATTYKVQAYIATGNAYINTRADGIGTQVSSITVMEIAQ